MSFKVPEEFRFSPKAFPEMHSKKSDGNNGIFLIKIRGVAFFCQASDGAGWEHVSVSIPKISRCPSWQEMCEIKNIFWEENDTVIQYHPAKSDYVNMMPTCLHLWRPIGVDFPKPDKFMVGV